MSDEYNAASTTETFRWSPTLLGLPPEVRQMIYGYYYGVINIVLYVRRGSLQTLETPHLHLEQSCRLLHSEANAFRSHRDQVVNLIATMRPKLDDTTEELAHLMTWDTLRSSPPSWLMRSQIKYAEFEFEDMHGMLVYEYIQQCFPKLRRVLYSIDKPSLMPLVHALNGTDPEYTQIFTDDRFRTLAKRLIFSYALGTLASRLRAAHGRGTRVSTVITLELYIMTDSSETVQGELVSHPAIYMKRVSQLLICCEQRRWSGRLSLMSTRDSTGKILLALTPMRRILGLQTWHCPKLMMLLASRCPPELGTYPVNYLMTFGIVNTYYLKFCGC